MQKNNNSIVVSSRIRFARNLAEGKFPHKLSAQEGYQVFCKVANAIEGLFPQKVYQLSALGQNDLGIMLEKRLVSQNLVTNCAHSGVVISSDETVSIMINEEDHLREQCILPGLSLEEAYAKLDSIDSSLDQKLKFAYDPKYGFLTSCVSNLGTGMRASVMMFLPALSLSGKISALSTQASQMGITVRGAKGEGSGEDGYLYQVSNYRSLGLSEKDILLSVQNVVRKIQDMEKEERRQLATTPGVALKDMIYRAYAVLTGAYSLGLDEFHQMLAQVKFGTVLGLFKFKDERLFDKLVLSCQPSGLERVAGHPLLGQNEGIFRADYVSRVLMQNRL